MIPRIRNDRLERLRARIKPVMRLIENTPGYFLGDPKGLLVYVEEKGPRKSSYYRNPRPIQLATGLE